MHQIKPYSLRRASATIEWDPNIGVAYIYFPPYSSRNPPKPDSSETVTGKFGVLTLDKKDGKIVGLEFHGIDANFDVGAIFK